MSRDWYETAICERNGRVICDVVSANRYDSKGEREASILVTQNDVDEVGLNFT